MALVKHFAFGTSKSRECPGMKTSQGNEIRDKSFVLKRVMFQQQNGIQIIKIWLLKIRHFFFAPFKTPQKKKYIYIYIIYIYTWNTFLGCLYEWVVRGANDHQPLGSYWHLLGGPIIDSKDKWVVLGLVVHESTVTETSR